jgi:hypothetical protein
MEKLSKKVNFVEQHVEQLLGLLDAAPPNAQKFRSPITQFLEGDLKALKKALSNEAVGNGIVGATDKVAKESTKVKARDEVVKAVAELVSAKGSKAVVVVGEHGDEHAELIGAMVKRRQSEKQLTVLLDVSSIMGCVTVQSLQDTLANAISDTYSVSSNSYSLSERWQEIVSAATRKSGSPVVAVLTELDRLRADEISQVAVWVCEKLASQLRVVLTCDVDGPLHRQIQERRNVEMLPLARIPVDARKKLAKQHVSGGEDVVDAISRMEHGHLCAYVKDAAQFVSAATGDKEATVRAMPGTLLGLYRHMLNETESTMGFDVVAAALGLLSVSVSGLTAEELSGLLLARKFKGSSVDKSTASTLASRLAPMLTAGAAGELSIKSWQVLEEMQARYKIKKADQTKMHKELGCFFADKVGSPRTAVAAIYHLASASEWQASLPLLESLGSQSLCCAEAASEMLSSLQASFSAEAVKAVAQLVACSGLHGLSDDQAKKHLSGNNAALSVLATGIPAKLSAAPFRAAVMVHSGINRAAFKEAHNALSQLCADAPADAAYHSMMAKGGDEESVTAFK